MRRRPCAVDSGPKASISRPHTKPSPMSGDTSTMTATSSPSRWKRRAPPTRRGRRRRYGSLSHHIEPSIGPPGCPARDQPATPLIRRPLHQPSRPTRAHRIRPLHAHHLRQRGSRARLAGPGPRARLQRHRPLRLPEWVVLFRRIWFIQELNLARDGYLLVDGAGRVGNSSSRIRLARFQTAVFWINKRRPVSVDGRVPRGGGHRVERARFVSLPALWAPAVKSNQRGGD